MLNHKRVKFLVLLWLAVLIAISTANAETDFYCQPDWANQAVLFEDFIFSENTWSRKVSRDLALKLQSDATGWKVVIEGVDGMPVVIRPKPQGVIPNPGDGSRLRHFVFGVNAIDPATNPELIVPGGKPPNQASVEPRSGLQGSVWLLAEKQAFDKNDPPRMTFLKFRACVRWNYGPLSESSVPDEPNLMPRWVLTAMQSCGLPDDLRLSTRMATQDGQQRAWLEPDLDGDARPDLVTLVERINDGRNGLAVCLQKNRTLTIMGLDTRRNDLPDGDFLAQMDWWAANDQSFTLGIEGASSQKVYLGKYLNFVMQWEGD